MAQGASLRGSEREEASKVVRLQEELRQCQEGRTQIAAQLSQLRSKEAGWEAEKKSLQRAGRAIAAAAAEDAARHERHGREGVRSATAEAGSSSARRVARKRDPKDPKAKAAESAAAEVEGALADARLQAGGPAQILQGRSKPSTRPSSSSASPAAAAATASKAATGVSPAPAAALARKAPAPLAPLGAPAASGGASRSKLSPVAAAPRPGAPSSGK